MKYCTNCGAEMGNADVFCGHCGAKHGVPVSHGEAVHTESILEAFTGSVSHLTGGKKEAVRPPFSKLFGQVMKTHSKGEAETIFACGTPETTPRLTSLDAAWPQPWLWSRVLLGMGLAFLMLVLCCEWFGNTNALPGTMILGSFMVPVAVMIFFFEINTPRNISFYTVLKVFLVGGCASLLVTLMLFSVFMEDDLAYGEAIMIGIIEETGKAAIVAYFIHREKNAAYHVNGLLIGAMVGAGFAAFESAGYAFSFLLGGGYDTMMEVIFLRAFLAPGGHVVWAAMSGFAMMLVKGDGPLSQKVFADARFWKIFAIPVVLHAIWDMPILPNMEFPLIQVLLTMASWIVVFVIIHNCLSQLLDIATESEACAVEPLESIT